MNRRQRRARAGHAGAAPAVRQALEHQKAGRLADAEAIYSRILAADPGQADALHFRGVLCYQTGNLVEARRMLERAVKAAPKAAAIRGNLGLVLEAAGDSVGAERAYKRAILLQPDHAEAHNNLGALYKDGGRPEEAEHCFRKAVAIAPNYGEALYNLGAVLMQRGAMAEAEHALRQALEVTPDNPDILIDLGVALQRQGRFDDAKRLFEQVLAAEPDNAAAHINLASLYFQWERHEDGEPHARRGAELAPNHPAAHNNLGNILAALRRFDDADASFRRAIALAPGYTDAIGNLANLMKNSGRIAEAVETYRRGLALAPGDARLAFGLSLSLLGAGAVEEAWRWYDAGFACGERRPDRRDCAPPWRGEDLAGRTLFVWPEQGVGDEILFASVFPDLAAEFPGASVVIECDARLVPSFARSFPWATVREEGAFDPAEADFQIAFGQLLYRYRPTLDAFAAPPAWLAADPDRRAEFRERLAAAGPELKVGINWRSGLVTARRAHGLTELDDWTPILTLPGVQPVSLQYGDCEAELKAVEDRLGVPVLRWGDLDLREDIDGVLALIAELDAVVNVGTSVMGMAGAVGTESLILLREQEWIMLGAGRMPWFANARVFERPVRDHWTAPIAAAAEHLSRLAANRGR